MKITDPMTILFNHVSTTLPDSLADRLSVVSALCAMMDDSHPAKAEAVLMKRQLESIQSAEVALQLKFQKIIKGDSL